MKIQSMIRFLPLLSLPLLQSCGGPATSTANLSVSSSFVATAGSLGLGGYVVVGENETTSKRFVLTLAGSTQTKVQLEKGRWKFAAIGWDGNAPFEGNTVCGSVPTTDLNTDTSTVEIAVTSAACSSAALISELNVKSIAPLACDIFYNYNQSTNAFSPLSTAFSDTFCSALPNDYRSDFSNYRLQALNINNIGQESAGFSSECKLLSTVTPLSLPSNKVPLLVKFFKNSDDCTNNRGAQTYLFKNGLSSGSPNFDHMFNYNGTRLLLSSARTKRGKSPFMSEIPRVLCGANGSFTDCLSEPVLNAHINVPFHNNDNREITVLKGVNPLVNACDPNTILSGSKYFSAETCNVKEREVKIKPIRNELLCQATPFFPATGTYSIKDMYQREGKTYILWYADSPTYKSKISVYAKTGKKINEYELNTNIYDEFAVSSDGSKIVAVNGTDAFFITINGGVPSGNVLSGKGGNQVEIDPSGSYFYVATGSYVKGYSSIGTLMSSVEPQPTLTVPFISMPGNGYIYVINENMEVRKASASAGGIGTFGAAIDVLAWIPDSFTVSGGKAYYQKNTELYYSIFDGNLPSNTMSLSAGAIATSIMDGKVYFAKDQGLAVYVNGATNTLLSTANNCLETITVSLGGATKSLAIESLQSQPLLPIWSDGLRLLGRRYFNDTDKPFYYFDSLADHDDGVRTGGRLERIQEMLGPEALGGFLSQYNTCAEVKAAAPFTRNHTFVDESKGEIMDFTLSVDANAFNEIMPNYICNDTDPSASSCSTPYDLILNFSHSDSNRREKMRIKLKCGSQKGTFESADVEYSPSDIRKELLVWNTMSDTQGRFEEYTLEQDTRKRGTLLRLEKMPSYGVLARWIEVELSGSQKTGSVSQFETSGGYVYTSRISVSNNLNDFNLGSSTPLQNVSYSFNDIVDNLDFFSGYFAEGKAFTSSSSTDIYGTTGSGGYFTSRSVLTSSKGIPLSINDMNIDDSSHPLVLTPVDPGAIFELTP